MMKTTSKKYPGWEIERIEEHNEVSYLMTHPATQKKGALYAVNVIQDTDGKWIGESRVWSGRNNEYITNKTTVMGPVDYVTQKIEERAAYWISQRNGRHTR